MAQQAGVESIDRRQGFANIKFHQQSKIDPFRLMALVRGTAGAQFTPAGVLKVPLKASANPAELISDLKNMLLELTGDLTQVPPAAETSLSKPLAHRPS